MRASAEAARMVNNAYRTQTMLRRVNPLWEPPLEAVCFFALHPDRAGRVLERGAMVPRRGAS